MGDEVEVEICREARIAFPLLVFGLPVFMLILGIILGGMLSEIMAVMGGAVFLALGFLLVKLADRYVAGQKRYNNSIIRLLGHS